MILINIFYRVGDEAYTSVVPDSKTKVLPKVYDDSLLLNTNDDISLYKNGQMRKKILISIYYQLQYIRILLFQLLEKIEVIILFNIIHLL